MRKLAHLDAELRKQIGLDTAAIADKLLGDAFVLAYRANPPGKTGEDQGIFLLRAQNAAVLADFLERLNRAQKESGDLKELDECRHAGAAYFRRGAQRHQLLLCERPGPCVLLPGGAAASGHRARSHRERHRSGGGPAAATTGADGALAALWINPRAFDAEMERNLEKAEGPERVMQRTFLRYWKALDGAALALRLDRDAALDPELAGPDRRPAFRRPPLPARGSPPLGVVGGTSPRTPSSPSPPAWISLPCSMRWPIFRRLRCARRSPRPWSAAWACRQERTSRATCCRRWARTLAYV